MRRQGILQIVGQGLCGDRGQDGRGQVVATPGDAAPGAAGSATADGAVQVVIGGVVGDQGIALVIARIEEDTDQGLVILRPRRGGFTEAGQVHGQGSGDAQAGQLGAARQEGATAEIFAATDMHG